MMLRIWFCSCVAVAFVGTVCRAQADGATPEEIADAVKWASEEPGCAAKQFLPGVDYPAVVRRCLARDAKSFRHLFALSAHTDAAASDLQSGILCIVLKHVGDDFFTGQLAKVAKPARTASLELLRYELFDQKPTPYGMKLSDYPKLTRLVHRPNQTMQPNSESVREQARWPACRKAEG